MVLVQKWPFFQGFFFRSIQARKMSFKIFQNEKSPFQPIKTRKSKSLKIDIFPKGLTHGFGLRMASFALFLRQYRPGKCLLRYYTTKKLFPRQTIISKSRKIDIFPKGLTYGFGIKMAIFRTLFFFKQNRPGKCFLQYFSKKKRLSWL